MSRTTTSFRLEDSLRPRLAAMAQREGLSVNGLIERFIREGLATGEHEGIQFKGGPAGRRPALAGGPDVWEVVDAVRGATGTEAERVFAVAAALGLNERQVAIALNYAAAHRFEIEAWIAANDHALDEAARVAEERKRLIA